MNIIKLNAIDSTSLFLKDLAKKSILENFTVVVADEQFSGKGQMNSVWHSEKNKNILCTVYVDLSGLPVHLIPYINFISAVKIRDVIESALDKEHKIKVKWPNDIMSYNDKVCGLLIENTIKNQEVLSCFIGIGLNVNQLVFPDHLLKASSLAKIEGAILDKDLILIKIVDALKRVMTVDYIMDNLTMIKQEYLSHLYKMNTPSMFVSHDENVFMGKIVGVNNRGLLLIEKEDEVVHHFAVKEVKFI
ncbi:MAG: biotin--[acetyl-CoA-carboxylase] ligase [Wenyingzhuangia sp.]|uniref:biotin--[acetyl-CoA-carboxylase] ligase n=1 Tax=Wenyingzhuangia sp. TaxID=1964193 RepID=UPI00321978FF